MLLKFHFAGMGLLHCSMYVTTLKNSVNVLNATGNVIATILEKSL